MSERASFAHALATARRRQQMSQRALAEAIGVRQSCITQWERGRTRPSNQHVFAVEQALKLPSGALARFLGFGPPVDSPTPDPPPTVVAAIIADRSLDEEGRELLIRLYRHLRDMRPARRRAHTRGSADRR